MPRKLLHVAAILLLVYLVTACANQPGSTPIADREADLEWLKDRYYRKPFVFRWPSTYVEEV